jgi:hypothetical protein
LAPKNITARTEPKKEEETFEEGVIPNGIELMFSVFTLVFGSGG